MGSVHLKVNTPQAAEDVAVPVMPERVADQFRVGHVDNVTEFRAKGNINLDAYEVRNLGGQRYLLQRLNTEVFTFPERVTEAMSRWTRTQAEALEQAAWAHPYEAMELVPTHDGSATWDHEGQVWRMLSFIENTVSYKSLAEAGDRARQIDVAYQTGRGLAVSTRLVAALGDAPLKPSLLGYRDTAGYYSQFDAVLAGTTTVEGAQEYLPADREVAEATLLQYLLAQPPGRMQARLADPEVRDLVDLANGHKQWSLRLQDAVETGHLRRTVIHGDTKIENFLFCADTGRVRSLVDLDTVMSYTWLADWGDLARSLVNVAGEKEPDTDRVRVDEDVYDALARGFLSVDGVAPQEETRWMPRAAMTITLELGLRFLTDYLRGDNYFRLGPGDPPDLNKRRAAVQLALFRRLAEYHGDC